MALRWAALRLRKIKESLTASRCPADEESIRDTLEGWCAQRTLGFGRSVSERMPGAHSGRRSLGCAVRTADTRAHGG